MINHILIPLDGSTLAECVLPHVTAIARAAGAHVTLIQVLEFPSTRPGEAIDPLDWHLKKREAEIYLESISARLRNVHLQTETVIKEGSPAEIIIDFANSSDVDLVAMSTHGRSGLSGWNISSVVQKITLRSYKSTLLVRAYKPTNMDLTEVRYNRLFVGLDCSARAEFILPVATNLARFYQAKLILGTVLRKPELVIRFPPSDQDLSLVNQLVERNTQVVNHYFDQVQKQISTQAIDIQTRQVVSDNVVAALHDMVEKENADLVMLVAHGRSGDSRWPYGSVTTSFIAYGTTSLLILQDLSGDEIRRTEAEVAVREIKGH